MESGALLVTNQSPPPTWKLVSVSSMAAGIQFAWSLQISILTPYIRTLGASPFFSSLLWLYTAFSSIFLQPILGHKSDTCTSRFGRRRPFIVGSTTIACLSCILIAFAKDIGYQTGDSPNKITKPRAISVFVVGFWLLDAAINTLQNPSRALLADLCLRDHSSMRRAMCWFSFFMAVGNILGYTIGAYARLHLLFPFTHTQVCDDNCANLKSCLLIALLILLIVTLSAVISVKEVQQMKTTSLMEQLKTTSFVKQMVSEVWNMSRPMKLILVVTGLNWLAWFPFILFGTDWVGKEVFGGDARGDGVQRTRYELGVRFGSLGLMVNSMVVALASLVVGPAARLLGGMKNLWCVANVVLVGGLVGMVVITKEAEACWGSQPADEFMFPRRDILGSTWLVYAVLGIPLAVSSLSQLGCIWHNL